MKLEILSWNVQGLNDYDRMLRVRNFLKKYKGDNVCLQETKLEIVVRAKVRGLFSQTYAARNLVLECSRINRL